MPGYEYLNHGISTTGISTTLFRSYMIEDVLVLVCKRPGLGKGKQRLAAGLGPDAANRIAEAMLACALEDARAWPGSVMIAPANRDDYSWAENLLPEAGSKVRVQPQADGNLGQRLNTLDHTLRNAGLERLFYIGSDAPALGAEDYAAAREALVNHDTVLVPSSDGGVVLMASRKPWPPAKRLALEHRQSGLVTGGRLPRCGAFTGTPLAQF